MRLGTIISSILLSTSACLAHAQTQPQQKQPTPEEMQKIMDATMGAMVPMIGRMTEVMIETQLRIAEKTDTAERIATFKRNLYEALLKKGFSANQALQITLATAIPSTAPSGK